MCIRDRYNRTNNIKRRGKGCRFTKQTMTSIHDTHISPYKAPNLSLQLLRHIQHDTYTITCTVEEIDEPGCTPSMYCLSLIHISEPTRRTPISYAVFCLKKKNQSLEIGLSRANSQCLAEHLPI
eukprot:TRINITY_DN8542_c0_g1_i3.p1 TRINITY_DN8542_c0_g1~~TRINITY_DN8542_c0_g1_i3.p1  ORF type:complete len:124 (+),score=11.06 TRINITY_DN8542_c0_g1_i3:64-435(+)